MVFSYAKNFDVGDKGMPHAVMRPRIPIRITNVRPARRGGSDSGYAAHALADSGADISLITREAADFNNIDFDALPKVSMMTPFGRFEASRAIVHIEIVYNGRRIDLGRCLPRFPSKTWQGWEAYLSLSRAVKHFQPVHDEV